MNSLYSYEPLEGVDNSTCRFVKLKKGDKCQYDEFERSITQSSDKESLEAIYALMNRYDPRKPLPPKKFRHIKGGGPKDIYEFKNDNIRVYVRVIFPELVVVLGGYKNNQKKDIAKVKNIVKDLARQQIEQK